MKGSRIVYKKNFQLAQFIFESVELEVPVNEGESVEQALDYAKSSVEDWHKKNNPVLATDYFKGPELIPHKDDPVSEVKALEQIKIALNNFQNRSDAISFIKKEYPDYIDHYTVKLIINTKPVKPNEKSPAKAAGKKH